MNPCAVFTAPRQATRKPLCCFFIVLAALCALCKPLIAVNYDMNDYLPPDTASTLALDAMNAEYDGGVPNARVMVKNVTIPEALAYKPVSYTHLTLPTT